VRVKCILNTPKHPRRLTGIYLLRFGSGTSRI
jgi:hypothetical protein